MDMENNSVLPHGYVLQGAKQSYVIDRVLGQGSFGITYLAKYKTQITGQMGRGSGWMQVCVKEFFMRDMNSRDERTMALRDATGNSVVMKYRRAFMREARNLARMHHSGIVNVFEVIETNNTAYIVMEYIDGGSLDEYVARRGRLPEKEALACFEPICDAMSYMHAQRMLHLDMKPKNVMRDEEGHLYLIDFGLSKQYMENGQPESSTTIGLGTPGYAPLEQAEQRDDREDFRTTLDVYALGGTLYKMLTGQTPPTANEVNAAVLDGDNLILSELKQAGVSAQVAKVVSTAMWPGAKKRYQTVVELMKALGWTAKTYQAEAKVKAPVQEDTVVVDDTVKEETTPVGKPTPQPTPTPTPQPQPVPTPKRTPKWLWPAVACAVVAAVVFFAVRPRSMTPEEMYQIGEQYYYGTYGKPQDYTQAVEWYRKAAEQGLARAQCDLGWCYDEGEGVPQSYESAVEWYRKAAEQGHAQAQFNLGYCYQYGEGVPQSYESAVEWYRKAAEQGNARAQFNLGVCYENGEGVPQSYETAVEWYRKAAEQGDAGAQCNLGYSYKKGNGVPQSYETAVEWYRKAAEQGHAQAQCNLGYSYDSGQGVPQSYETAVEWYRKAAEQGNAGAQCNLGFCYKYGKGVPQSYETAVEWIRKAAEQGYATAQCNLGVCYEDGTGVEKNLATAKEWYQKAAKQGNDYAIRDCQRLGVSYK